MICENCKQKKATVHYTQINNGVKVEVYLCEECASEKSNLISLPEFGNLLTGMMGIDIPYKRQTPALTKCESCGMSYEQFEKSGKMGCANCYTVYADKIKPLIKRIHGNNAHTGKVPSKINQTLQVTKEIDELKMMLDEAIKDERYEDAAIIRDKIKGIKG